MHVTLCLTHDCNLRCAYCYAGTKERRHMDVRTGRRAIDLGLTRTSKRLHLVFFGGEPLVRWEQLVSLTGYARERASRTAVEVRPTVTTNATLLTAERAAWLAREQFVVAISCDGMREAHDRHRVDRRGCGSFDRTWKGLHRALASGLSVRVVLVLHPSTVAMLPQSVAMFVEAGATDIVVNPDWSAGWEGDDVREAWKLAYEGVAEQYVEGYRTGRPFWISILDPKIAAYIKGGYGNADRCDLGRRNLVVAPSGNLYPCDRMVGDDRDTALVVGHVREGADRARVARVVQETCDVPTACVGCAIASRCRNRCACANLALTGSVGSPSETLCFHEQLCVFAADGVAERLFAEQNARFLRRHYGSEVPLGSYRGSEA